MRYIFLYIQYEIENFMCWIGWHKSVKWSEIEECKRCGNKQGV